MLVERETWSTSPLERSELSFSTVPGEVKM